MSEPATSGHGGRFLAGIRVNLLGRPALMILEFAASVAVARVLGAELLAALIAIRALAQLSVAVADLGITNSMSKLVPDLIARRGRAASMRTALALTLVRLAILPLVLGAVVLLERHGAVDFGATQTDTAIIAIAAVLGGLSIISATRRAVLMSALQVRAVIRQGLIMAVAMPAATVAAAMIWRTPVAVAMAIALAESVNAWVLCRRIRFMPTESAQSNDASGPKSLTRRYAEYGAMNYAKFLFNKAVIRNPMLLLVLGAWGAQAATIANAAIALALVFRVWELINLPLAQMRAPLLSWLHAQADTIRMGKLQLASNAMVVVAAGVLGNAGLALAEPVIGLVYGPQFALAAGAMGPLAIAAAAVAMFSLGNNTLQQTERFAPQLAAMLVALVVLCAVSLLWRPVVAHNQVLAGVGLLVLARFVFWLLTDVAADWLVFAGAHSPIKLRGLIALFVGAGTQIQIEQCAVADPLLAALVGVVSFLAIFRLLGGIGANARALARSVLPGPWHSCLRLL